MMSFMLLQACDNPSKQTGVDNDGMKLGDTSGGKADTPQKGNQSATDTPQGEHRVDISNRDTFNKKLKK